MQSKNIDSVSHTPFSRRGLLKGATGVAALARSAKPQGQENDALTRRPFAYVGTYTGAIGGGGNGQGIYLYQMNPNNGRLLLVKVASQVPSPSSIAISPSRKYLYCVNEISNFNGGTSGSVSSFAIDASNGDLRFLNVVSSEGAGPAHLSVHPTGKFVFVANYGGGSVAVLPVNPDGSLGPASDTHQNVDSLGPTRATSAPPGSFAISGHDAPHAHMIQSDPDGRNVLFTDLGQDRIYISSFDVNSGMLSSPTYASVPPGDGPRHFAFHPNGQWLYSIQEEGSTVIYFLYDSTNGMLTAQQTISTLPRRFVGTNFTSEIGVSPDGQFLYAANRLHDTIAVFSIDDSGGLTHVSETSTLGDYPRNFAIDPSGNFMYVCNQRSDSITSFLINRGTGRLTFTGDYTPVGSPSIIVF